MPFTDVIQKHFSAAEQTTFNDLMSQLEALLQPHLQNLSEEENKKYGSINEQNKLLVNKMRDYHQSQPSLSSPDVDWTEFMADFSDRSFLEKVAMRVNALSQSVLETKRLHDYDNYQNALLDYKYAQYKAETDPGNGYDSKAAELQQFFPGAGTTVKPDAAT